MEASGRAGRLVGRKVRERLLAQIGGRPGGHVAAGFVVWGRWLVPALAATSIVLGVALRNEVVRSHHRAVELERAQTVAQQLEIQAAHSRAVLDILTAPDTVKVTLVAGAARPVPQGKAFYHSTKGLLFYVVNLTQLPRDRIYQLWLIPQQGIPISAGIFQTDARGDGQILLPQLPSGVTPRAFAVTIEPAGGVPQPTGPKVLVGVVS